MTAAITPTVPARPSGATRVLHTSDWHLGVAVRNHPRSSDHDELIAELVAIAAAAQPDLIVHTGDVFDGHRPAMAEFGRAIKAFRALGEIAPVVVLAGNHDSAVALEVLGVAVGDDHTDRVLSGRYDPHSPCADRIRIHPRPTPAAKGAVATYPTAAGGRLRLVALPFVHANRVLVDFDDLVEANATYNDSLRKIIGALSTSCFDGFDPSADVAVFASHLHVKDARTSSEKTIHIAEDYATDPAHLEARFGYLAFGHIHVPQPIAAGRGQYAGSILEVDFGERGEQKRVVVVDLEAGRPTITTSVPLTAGRRLHTVRCPLSALAEHAVTIGRGIVEVTITAEPNQTPPFAGDPDGTATAASPASHVEELIIVDGQVFDTLSQGVAACLPNAAVVGVIDARRRNVTVADELDVPAVTETVNDSFRRWLSDSADQIFTRHGDGLAVAERVAAMFDESNAAVVSGAPVEFAEAAALTTLIGDES